MLEASYTESGAKTHGACQISQAGTFWYSTCEKLHQVQVGFSMGMHQTAFQFCLWIHYKCLVEPLDFVDSSYPIDKSTGAPLVKFTESFSIVQEKDIWQRVHLVENKQRIHQSSYHTVYFNR